MNYHLNQRGENRGTFTLEELRRRRQAGSLTGSELVWREGMADWQPLDVLLEHEAAGSIPPPVPNAARRKLSKPVWAAIIGGSVVMIAYMVFVGVNAYKIARRSNPLFRSGIFPTTATAGGGNAEALEAASKPLAQNTNSLTAADAQKRDREFRIRQYLDGYKLRGNRNPAYDAQATGLIGNWIARYFGGDSDTNLPPLGELSNLLANNPACDDPMVLTVAAMNTPELHESLRRLERAVRAFDHSKHRAFPRFYATTSFAGKLFENRLERLPVLDAAAMEALKESFHDGSLLPGDQAELGEILVHGWGNGFFSRNQAGVCALVKAQGKPWHWLALVLDGEREIQEAWTARGSGYSDTVGAKGFQGFADHLAKARQTLTAAWELQPNLPLAPDRMITVALGDESIGDMRQWFDRTVAAQMDYPDAYSEMRWGLRPRWYGDLDSMLAFGVMALNSKRFDTDTPRVYYQAVYDVELEMGLARGQHIFSRPDIWPNLQRMYDGYIAQATNRDDGDSWRGAYSAVAYLAGKYDTARQQLEAVDWKPGRNAISGWGTDLSLMPLKIAALTGPLGKRITAAESTYDRQDVSAALGIYTELSTDTAADARTRLFIQNRLATLRAEQQLIKGEWVDFLPADDNLTGWQVEQGKFHRLPDGTLEAQAGPEGHLLFSHIRVGWNFEVEGEFETVKSSTEDFQAGLVMGIPEINSDEWFAFRLKRNRDEGDVASFSDIWSRNQIVKGINLNDKTNSFKFRLRDGRVSASVNRQSIFKEVRRPQGTYHPTQEVWLGVGAFNDMNDTTIHYRKLRVRKIKEP